MTNTNLHIELNEEIFGLNLKEELSNITASFERLKNEVSKESSQELRDELYRIDQMRNDVLHIVELMNFNAVEGYKFSKMLQVILKARRKVKDRLSEREQIKAMISSYESAFKLKVTQAIGSLNTLDKFNENRTYRLRQLTELEGFNKVINEQQKKLKVS